MPMDPNDESLDGYCGALFTERPVFDLGQHYEIAVWKQ